MGKETVKLERNLLMEYFSRVYELSKSGEQFPVNLDEVWPLAYERKEHAVRDLRKMCVQSVDYSLLPKFGEKVLGHRPADDYRISIPCLEWLIARKVRAVFEVYRRVFHLVTDRHEQPKILRTQTYNMPDFMKLCSTFIRHEAVGGTYCVAAMFSDAGAVQSGTVLYGVQLLPVKKMALT
ncbi:MAG: hypothetical protein LBJ72_01650 [Dysgonamonadaceae bacterium]|nr:hypothetical protein [Dysgonamonadaceae bacterium]